MIYKKLINITFFVMGTFSALYAAFIGITEVNTLLCVSACINELMLLALLHMVLSHKKYGRFVINTSDPKKDIYTVQLDEIASLSNKDEIILEVYVDDKCSSQ